MSAVVRCRNCITSPVGWSARVSVSPQSPFLYVVVCAAGVAPDVGTLIPAAPRLRATDVRISTYEPHPPKSAGGADRLRWEEALDLLPPLGT